MSDLLLRLKILLRDHILFLNSSASLLHGESIYFYHSVYHNYCHLSTGSHHGSITESSIVLFQSVHFVSDGRVVNRSQQSVSFLYH